MATDNLLPEYHVQGAEPERRLPPLDLFVNNVGIAIFITLLALSIYYLGTRFFI